MGDLTGLRDPQDVARDTRHYLYHPLWCGPRESVSAIGRALAVGQQGMRPTGIAKKEDIQLDRLAKDPSASLDFRIAEDWNDANLVATLRFKVTGLADNDELEFSLNGKTVRASHIRRVFDSDGQTAREGIPLPPFHLYILDMAASKLAKFGDNRFGVRLAKNLGDASLIVRVEDLEAHVPRKALKQR